MSDISIVSSTDSIEYIDLYLHGKDINDNIISDKLSLFFQEIELALQIGPNEIWGIKESIALYRYIFNQYVTITQIKNEISTYIVKNCQHSVDFQYTISVELISSAGKDLVYILFNVIALDENGQPETYQQKFLIGS